MRILFVFPSILPYKKKPSVTFHRMGSPYVFRYLASVTPDSHDIEIVDERFEKIDYNQNYDIVGITVYTVNSKHAYEIAGKFRKRGVTVILGGPHPTVLLEEAKQYADAVVVGEAEEIWPQLLKDFDKGKLKPIYRQTKPVDLSKISLKNDKLNKVKTIRNTVGASRGCPNHCEFCYLTNNQFGRVYRTRPIKGVRDELSSIQQKQIFFHDASITVNVNHTKHLFKEIQDLNKKFICCGTVDVLSSDDELLSIAREAGCVEWFVGFESILQKNIVEIGKSTNEVKEYTNAVKKIHNHGMLVTGSFIFGFDGDTKNIFSKTLNAVLDMNLDSTAFHILTPYPGTPLFARLEKEGRILTKDWSKYIEMDDVVFQPKNMTPLELLEGVNWIKKQYYSYIDITKRTILSAKLGLSPLLLMTQKNLP